MKTVILNPNNDINALSRAVSLLKNDEIVAIPTETVYGLAGNAFSRESVNKIFKVKGRPSDNPLIVHISDYDMLKTIVTDIPTIAIKLAEKFWPGALTMILPSLGTIPKETNCGLDTVAVRIPQNEIALNLIKKCNFPLAAPSANKSGRPSPTRASHVMDDIFGEIPLILDGGECRYGLESTVVIFINNRIKILRPGGVTLEMLSEFAEVGIDKSVITKLEDDEKPISPGTKHNHYAPRAEVKLIRTNSHNDFINYINQVNKQTDKKILTLVSGEEKLPDTEYMFIGVTAQEQSRNIFAKLREADKKGAEIIFIKEPEINGIGLALYNRLIRAAGFCLIEL